jgi:putative alpha-1,2-mannosidase
MANPYVQHLQVGGRPWSRAWITHDELRGAGTLHFDLGAQAGAGWGTGAVPPSPCG